METVEAPGTCYGNAGSDDWTEPPTDHEGPSAATADDQGQSGVAEGETAGPVQHLPTEDFFLDSIGTISTINATSADLDSDDSRDGGQPDALTVLQAVVFLEDAALYRSIHHKVDKTALRLYQIYYSLPIIILRNFIIFLIHALAFFEHPSSLTYTSDMRYRGQPYEFPCGVTESIEMLCLAFLLADVIVKVYLVGRHEFAKSKWVMACVLVIVVSMLDWMVTVILGCREVHKFRRLLRPFFLLQNSSLMKKTVNCLRRTLPEVASVLLLLGLHLYIFTLIGILLFAKPSTNPSDRNISEITTPSPSSSNASDIVNLTSEETLYFRTLLDAFMSLLVLLTTANNPDITMPAYNEQRLYAIYFMIFLVIGLYCLMNMLTAVIYNQFRGYFLNSMQASFFRRRLAVRAAFEVLRKERISFHYRSEIHAFSVGVRIGSIRTVIEKANFPKASKKMMLKELKKKEVSLLLSAVDFQDLFDYFDKRDPESKVVSRGFELTQKPSIVWVESYFLRSLQRILAHKYFTFFGNVVAFVNMIAISVELTLIYDDFLTSSHAVFRIVNLIFILYYVLEQASKLWALGWRRFVWDRGNLFDACITAGLVVAEILYLTFYGVPSSSNPDRIHYAISLGNLIKFINLLIMVRVLRIIPHIKAMSLVTSTLFDLVRNLKSFGGILVVIYYTFAIMGMEIFKGSITYDANGTNTSFGSNRSVYGCGTYQQLGYWANNFDDFAAAIVVLWDIMVVNNWYIFLAAYSEATTKWAYLFFIVWWLFSVVIILNLFTALILENFIMKWDRHRKRAEGRSRTTSYEDTTHLMSVHDMFRDSLQEPAEEELLVELHRHRFLNSESLVAARPENETS